MVTRRRHVAVVLTRQAISWEFFSGNDTFSFRSHAKTFTAGRVLVKDTWQADKTYH